ncbi:MAG: hypothetical protein RLZZ618_3538 [Pseudomonadota bacterium]|jgi:glycosyltransferase involved in cell wall biosynthesis
MRILLIHQNFPGQFRHVAQAWAARPGWQVLAIGRDTAPGLPGIRCLKYKLSRVPHPAQHHYLRSTESAVLHGQAVARMLLGLKRQGFVPDVIVAHPGWGETLYAKDVFPQVRLVHFCEWFYGTADSDVGFDPEFPSTFDDRARVRTWNALHLLNLENCDAGVSPTQWQQSRHPAAYQPKIMLAHEGVDTEALGPDATATFELPDGRMLRAGDPVVTYVARQLEPYRGFHNFMRSLQALQKSHPRCHVVIVGGDSVSYGKSPQDAANWREKMLGEIGAASGDGSTHDTPGLDMERISFLGRVPYDRYCRLLQVSAVHVYLTYPFVLSWAMLEAMASGCLVVGSRTAPVQEVLEDGVNGVLVDFFDPADIARKVGEVLSQPEAYLHMRRRARADVGERFGRASGIAAYDQLLGLAGTERAEP